MNRMIVAVAVVGVATVAPEDPSLGLSFRTGSSWAGSQCAFQQQFAMSKDFACDAGNLRKSSVCGGRSIDFRGDHGE